MSAKSLLHRLSRTETKCPEVSEAINAIGLEVQVVSGLMDWGMCYTDVRRQEPLC